MKKDDVKNFWIPLITATMFLVVLALNAPCCFGEELEVECIDLGYEYMSVEELESYDIKPENVPVWEYFGSTAELKHRQKFCKMTGLDINKTEFYQPDELSTEYLTARTPDDRIVCVHIGVCMDTENFRGCILNTTSYFDGTSYAIRNRDGEVVGSTADIRDIVVSYFLYDPSNKYYDDYSIREDFIVDNLSLFAEGQTFTDGDL